MQPSLRTSLCMIVRDEAEHLRGCLASVQNVFDEMVVVDTGSSDESPRVAAAAGARVVSFPWNDDFAAARNFSKSRARGEWVCWIDADERLAACDQARLRELLSVLSSPDRAYLMRQSSVDLPGGGALQVDQVRLFPNLPAVCWEGMVHEQLAPSLRAAQCSLRQTDVVIQHLGYCGRGTLAAKRRRNLALLRRQWERTPDNPYWKFLLGQALCEEASFDDGLPLLLKAHQEYDQSDLLFRHVAATTVRVLRQCGRPGEAARIANQWPRHRQAPAALLYEAACLAREAGKHDQAEALLRRLIAAEPPRSAAYDDPTLASTHAPFLLGLVLWHAGRQAEARDVWRKMTAADGGVQLGWRGLGLAALWTGDEAELERCARQLQQLSRGAGDALILRSQHALQIGDAALARSLLADAIALDAFAIPPRLLLAQLFLRDEATWPDAEQLLVGVLNDEPTNAEARHNLAVLRKKTAPSRAGLSN